MILLELIGSVIFLILFFFPVWIHGNWKTIFDKDYIKYVKESNKEAREYHKMIIKNDIKNKICTQYQPFKLDDKLYVTCNFICDGDCRFKDTKYYKINYENR